ncbi:MAG: anti-sigma factor [Beijerinckiaceae bacterium]
MNGDLNTAAAEYVLGTLDDAERAEFERRLAAEPEARRAVALWRERLTPLTDSLESVAPPPHVWSAIEARLDEGTGAAPGGVVDLAAVRQLRRNVRFWRGATALAGAMAAALALFAIDRALLNAPAPGKSYVAVVNRGGDIPALIIRIDTAAHAVFVRPLAAETPQGRSLELWYINAGQAPKSLGLVRDAPVRVALPDDPAAKKVTLAVTSEPPGGSPTGGPTGPIVYSGQLFEE